MKKEPQTPPIPDGYRRVSNGYTRKGDFVWDETKCVWGVVKELELVNKVGIVIRPKAKE